MDLHITLRDRGRYADDIYTQLRAAIVDGSLRPGARLPSTRALGASLAVARNTVAGAYERLAAEGFLVGRAGGGTTVSGEVGAFSSHRHAPAGVVRPSRRWRGVAAPADDGARPTHDFGLGMPDVRAFPFADWRRTLQRALKSAAEHPRGPDPAGRAELRAAIARSVAVSRAVQAGPEDVVVTNGAQQALDLIARVVLEQGDTVAVEDPGYPLARQLFESVGARVRAVAVDGEGLDVRRLPDRARAVYVTPSHQFPLGMPMSLERRLALLAWAERREAIIIEDDYDTELRFEGRPLEPLQRLDRAGRVLYVGTFSKVLFPGLRLGFVVAPPTLVPALAAAKRLADGGTETVGQGALARFIDSGALGRHIRRMTRVYRARRERLVAGLTRDFSRWFEVVPGAAGLHLAATSRGEIDLERVARLVAAQGVRVGTLAEYFRGRPTAHGLVLGYGSIPLQRIDGGLERLLACVRSVARGR